MNTQAALSYGMILSAAAPTTTAALALAGQFNERTLTEGT